jgi:hypothetical protein
MRSLYFWRMRSASALRFSKGCSSLNLDRMVADVCESGWVWSGCGQGKRCKWCGEAEVIWVEEGG